jgi:hypothetical protein
MSEHNTQDASWHAALVRPVRRIAVVRPAGVPRYRTDDLLSHLDDDRLQVDIIAPHTGPGAAVDARCTLAWGSVSAATHDVVIAPEPDHHLRWRLHDPDSPHHVVGNLLGDPTLDRLRAGRAHRQAYRARWRVGERDLVAVVSGAGPSGLVEARPQLLEELLADLPVDEYQVVLALHPQIWHTWGACRLRAWLRPYLAAGLVVAPPEHGWQAAILAADHVIGDLDQMSTYAHMMGRHTMTVTTEQGPEGPRAGVGVLTTRGSVRTQVVTDALRQDAHTLERYQDRTANAWQARHVGLPAQWSGRPVVEGLYTHLGLEAPAVAARPPVFESAAVDARRVSAPLWVRTDGDDVEVWVRRLPADLHPRLGADQLMVDQYSPAPHRVGSANVVVCVPRPQADPWVEIEHGLAELPRSHSRAGSVAVAYPLGRECLVGYANGRRYRLSPTGQPDQEVDPRVFACVLVRAHRHAANCALPLVEGVITVRLGRQTVPVRVRSVDLRDGGPNSTHQCPYTRFGTYLRARRQDRGWSTRDFEHHLEQSFGLLRLPGEGIRFRHAPLKEVEAGRVRPDAHLLQHLLIQGLGEPEPVEELLAEFCTDLSVHPG